MALSVFLRKIEDIKLGRGRPSTYCYRSFKKAMAEKELEKDIGSRGGAPKDVLALSGILLEKETPLNRPSDVDDDDDDDDYDDS